MSFCVYGKNMVLCNNQRIIIYDLHSGKEDTIHLPDLEVERKMDIHNNIDIDMYHSITTVSFSQDGNYFLVCTNRKQLCLYETKNQKLVSNRSLCRAASKVKFLPNNDIVVADKAGDAYLYCTANPVKNGTFILGHLSMLLDILITEDEKYILTTDRDEKIRISMYPNSYNILTYCLGHTKFVTNISELPHEKSVLISSGGDGIFVLWNYKCGTELLRVNFCEKLLKEDIYKLVESLRNSHTAECVNTLPVKHMRLTIIDETSSLLLISFYCSTTLLIYNIKGTIETNFKVTYLSSMTLKNEPIEILLNSGILWVLTSSGFLVYKSHCNNFVLDDTLDCKLERLNILWDSLKTDVGKQNLFQILYKRKYDNVQEYLERKKLRLANTME